MTTTCGLAETFTAPEVILFSGDVARAAEFYKALGFAETFRVPQEGPPIHVDLQLDGYKIGFASIESARNDHGLDQVTSGQRATITLWTQDTARAYRTLTTAGIPGLAAPSIWLGRLLIAWVQDPDGHPIQLVQRLDNPASSALA
jgi:glyoxylase I family protein